MYFASTFGCRIYLHWIAKRYLKVCKTAYEHIINSNSGGSYVYGEVMNELKLGEVK